ncbi:tetratricopeptide repeat protein [Nonomuraea sp. NPDC050556]|uniref:AfsR/SARP family transcriptional regulator n=1 Tax=Nonomuraea sp. NPDC050556 TaxID=3364369 RepID=UPI0037B75D98
MEFRLLGAVEAYANGRRLALGPRKQRLIFAVLALEANHPVPVERLVELNWPVDPPRTAQHAIRVSVSQLRSILGGIDPDRSAVELTAQGAGYMLRTAPHHIDAHRFRELVRRAGAEEDDERRVALLDQGLSLWRGPALDGAAPQQIQERLGSGLEESRLVALEDRIEAELRLGRHRRLLEELTGLAGAHPFRERLTCQLMLALYRGGQTRQALEVARETRRRLADELGIDPSLDLQRLELAILRNDPALLRRPESTRVSPKAVPAQLPPAVADFTGRSGQLAWLEERLQGTVTITGAAGVGKTALAVHWAQRVRDRFPDGQLHVDLRGFATGGPMRPEQALARLLRSLGVPPDQVPQDADEAAALYRTMLAGRRVLVLLDNAAAAEQVRPLLPGADGCLALVTSRDRLNGLVALDGARQLRLAVLDPEEARGLLAAILGAERVEQEPGAAAELARLCDHLPLALRIAAINLSQQHARPLAAAAAELAGSDRLNALRIDGQAAVRAALDLSYAALDAADQRLFRLLGLSPGPDIGAQAASALAGAPLDRVRHALDRLERTHLVLQPSPGRYGFHDLVRLYAREGAEDGSLDGLFAFYLGAAEEAKRLLYPQTLQLAGPTHEAPLTFDTPAAALAWLDLERANLVAAVVHGPRRVAWKLADTLRGYLSLRRDPDDWRSVAEAARTAAALDGDLQAQAAAELSLAQAHQSRGMHRQALHHYAQALALARGTGWAECESAVLNNVGNVHWKVGALQDAADHFGSSIAISARTGQRTLHATGLANLSMVHRSMGRLSQALQLQHEALALCREIPYRNGEAIALENLGELYRDLGELDRALDHLDRALPMFRQSGNRYGEVLVLDALAAAHREAGRCQTALDLADRAVELAVAIGDRRAEADALNTRATVLTRLGSPERAVAEHGDALALARELGNLQPRLEALVGLAAACLANGEPEQARAHARKALSGAHAWGFHQIEAQARLLSN